MAPMGRQVLFTNFLEVYHTHAAACIGFHAVLMHNLEVPILEVMASYRVKVWTMMVVEGTVRMLGMSC